MPRWIQRQIILTERPRGIHLITDELLRQLPEIYDFQVGLVHFFLQHTSASLAINERVDDDVRIDLERHLNTLAPEDAPYTHSYEGPDDMPGHIKSVLIGAEVTVPIANGRLSFGAWQGLYLCEHRNQGGRRRVIVTIQGEPI